MAGWGATTVFALPQVTSAESKPVKMTGEADVKHLLMALQPGLSEDRVRELLGPPKGMARQVLHLRYLEQWVYESPLQIRVEIDHSRSRQPQLLTVHLVTSEKP